MNKRQHKKVAKKCIYPLVDEINLLTMNKEEQEKAVNDFQKYCQMHCRFFHYSDKNKRRKPLLYTYPYGKEFSEHIVEIFNQVRMRTRKYNNGLGTNEQNIN